MLCPKLLSALLSCHHSTVCLMRADRVQATGRLMTHMESSQRRMPPKGWCSAQTSTPPLQGQLLRLGSKRDGRTDGRPQTVLEWSGLQQGFRFLTGSDPSIKAGTIPALKTVFLFVFPQQPLSTPISFLPVCKFLNW